MAETKPTKNSSKAHNSCFKTWILGACIGLGIVGSVVESIHYNLYLNRKIEKREEEIMGQQTQMLFQKYDLKHLGVLDSNEVRNMYGSELVDLVMKRYDWDNNGFLDSLEVGISRKDIDFIFMRGIDYKRKWHAD